MDNFIKIEKISKAYKHVPILKEISFEIHKGKIYGFVGPNGAGKTTTIKVLCGLTKADSGKILYQNEQVSNLYEAMNGKLGALVNEPSFYGDLSAEENLKIISIYKKAGSDDINEILEVVGLKDAGKKKCKNFSLGMKQRLGIAEALIGKPQLLILDEPINGLDPQGIYEIRELITELKEKYETTIIISSHILNELEMVCDELIIIDGGQIKFCGDLDGLKAATNSEKLEECYFKILRGASDDKA